MRSILLVQLAPCRGDGACDLPESNQGIISLRQQLVFTSFFDDSRSGLVHVLARFLSGKAGVPIEHHFEFCVSSIYIWCSRGELQTTNTATAHCFSTL
jgi:hypothetical protein